MASEERREQVARQIGALMLTYELTEAADVGATVVLAMGGAGNGMTWRARNKCGCWSMRARSASSLRRGAGLNQRMGTPEG